MGHSGVTLFKKESYDFVEQDTVKEFIKKYSQFINCNIDLWGSSTTTAEEPIDEDEESTENETKEDKEEVKPKLKKDDKTTWNWELCIVDSDGLPLNVSRETITTQAT